MLTTRNRIGLVIAALLGLGDVISVFAVPTPAEGEDGPPMGILIFCGILGVITLVAVVIAWRTAGRTALRTIAGARVLSALTSVPAFFADIPAGLLISVAVGIVLTVICVVLILAPAERPVPVTD
jgi:hypothetical protein